MLPENIMGLCHKAKKSKSFYIVKFVPYYKNQKKVKRMGDFDERRRVLPEPKKKQPSVVAPTYLETVDGERIYSSDIGLVTLDSFGRARRVRLMSHGYVSEPQSPY